MTTLIPYDQNNNLIELRHDDLHYDLNGRELPCVCTLDSAGGSWKAMMSISDEELDRKFIESSSYNWKSWDEYSSMMSAIEMAEEKGNWGELFELHQLIRAIEK